MIELDHYCADTARATSMFASLVRRAAAASAASTASIAATSTPAAALLPNDLFRGKVVFITGGGSGINLGIAKTFAQLGAHISICGRTAERLAGAKAELEACRPDHVEGKSVVHTHTADVRDYDEVAAALADAQATIGAPVHTLVCGAAGNFLAPAAKLSPNGFGTVVDIDLNGTFNACRAAFEQLAAAARADPVAGLAARDAGAAPSIIAITAGQAYIPYAYQCHAGAAKAGVENLMKNLANEWGPFGIRCNSVSPGPITGTEGMSRLGPAPGTPLYDELTEAIPARRYGTVDEVANAAAFLASPLARYVTGSRLDVDGGMNLPGSGQFGSVLGKWGAEEAAKAAAEK